MKVGKDGYWEERTSNGKDNGKEKWAGVVDVFDGMGREDVGSL